MKARTLPRPAGGLPSQALRPARSAPTAAGGSSVLWPEGNRASSTPRPVFPSAAAILWLSLMLLAACGRAPDGVSGRALMDAPGADVSEAPAPLEIPADAPRVVFLGDSLGAGLHLAEHQAFPAVLQRLLATEGLPFLLINNSESGRTTSGGLTALDWSLKSHPEVVVIELGANDGLRGIDPAVTGENLEALIARSKAAGAEVLLLGVRLPPNYAQFATRFDALYPALAARLGARFVPFFMEGVGGIAAMNLPDGLHPTAEGHERLAENIAPVLREVLQGLPAR